MQVPSSACLQSLLPAPGPAEHSLAKIIGGDVVSFADIQMLKLSGRCTARSPGCLHLLQGGSKQGNLLGAWCWQCRSPARPRQGWKTSLAAAATWGTHPRCWLFPCHAEDPRNALVSVLHGQGSFCPFPFHKDVWAALRSVLVKHLSNLCRICWFSGGPLPFSVAFMCSSASWKAPISCDLAVIQRRCFERTSAMREVISSPFDT